MSKIAGDGLVVVTVHGSRYIGVSRDWVSKDKIGCIGTSDSKYCNDSSWLDKKNQEYDDIVYLNKEEKAKVRDFIFNLVDSRPKSINAKEEILKEIEALKEKIKQL